jgi:hypothetical protein
VTTNVTIKITMNAKKIVRKEKIFTKGVVCQHLGILKEGKRK